MFDLHDYLKTLIVMLYGMDDMRIDDAYMELSLLSIISFILYLSSILMERTMKHTFTFCIC